MYNITFVVADLEGVHRKFQLPSTSHYSDLVNCLQNILQQQGNELKLRYKTIWAKSRVWPLESDDDWQDLLKTVASNRNRLKSSPHQIDILHKLKSISKKKGEELPKPDVRSPCFREAVTDDSRRVAWIVKFYFLQNRLLNFTIATCMGMNAILFQVIVSIHASRLVSICQSPMK
jgi:hypothetical protein